MVKDFILTVHRKWFGGKLSARCFQNRSKKRKVTVVENFNFNFACAAANGQPISRIKFKELFRLRKRVTDRSLVRSMQSHQNNSLKPPLRLMGI